MNKTKFLRPRPRLERQDRDHSLQDQDRKLWILLLYFTVAQPTAEVQGVMVPRPHCNSSKKF